MNARVGLLEKTRHAWGGSSPLRQTAEELAAGDIFVLEGLAAFDVEWVVLAQQSPSQILVVAADGQPLVGSADFEIPASASGGPLVLRCRFGGWVDAGLLVSATRTGSLGSGHLTKARDRRAEVEGVLADGSNEHVSAGSVLALEVDDDSEYLAWVRATLEPAWQALSLQDHKTVSVDPDDVEISIDDIEEEPTNPDRPPRPRYGVHLMSLAAIVLLALGISLFWRQHQEILVLGSDVEGYLRDLEDQRRKQEKLKDKYQQQLYEAAVERERLETNARQQLDELDRRLDAALSQNVVVNPVVEQLDLPRNRRGRAKRLRLRADASHLLLAVPIYKPIYKSAPELRAELLSLNQDKVVWVGNRLRTEPLGLWIGIPADLIPPGEYLLRIFELEEGSTKPEAEYSLEILHK